MIDLHKRDTGNFEVSLKAGVRTAWISPVGLSRLAYQQELLVRPGMMQRIVDLDCSGPVPVIRMEVTPE